MAAKSPGSSAKGSTLMTTHGTTARPIHSERRRSPRAASSASATMGMSTTVFSGSSCQRTSVIPAVMSGAIAANGRWRRTPSGRHAATAARTPQTVTSGPWAESAASATSTGTSRTAGSQATTVRRARRAATRDMMAARPRTG